VCSFSAPWPLAPWKRATNKQVLPPCSLTSIYSSTTEILFPSRTDTGKVIIGNWLEDGVKITTSCFTHGRWREFEGQQGSSNSSPALAAWNSCYISRFPKV
jgi:hypothetical protein